jgi:GT2 family glycosyltransferase
MIRFPDGGNSEAWFSGANLGFKREVIQKVGFDMRYNFSYGHEDQDLALELKKHGYKRSAPQDVRTTVMHIGENYAKNDRSDAIIGKNTRLFISKWGFDPRFKPRPWIDE